MAGRALAPIDLAIANWKGFVRARQSWRRLDEVLAAMPAPAARLELPVPAQMLAVEAAPHRITVNCIAPGSVDTDMMDGTFTSMAARYNTEVNTIKQAALRGILLGRQGRPDDIAAAVAFFASEDASWITGQTLNVTGGTPMN